MSKLESAIVKDIIKRLKKDRPGLWVKLHGGLFQAVGLPDILGCYLGRFVGLEVKQPGKEHTTTKIQWRIIGRIRRAGGIAEVVTTVKEALSAVPKTFPLHK